MRKITAVIALALLSLGLGAQDMEWFDDAKLGIFIHWGIYAVDGVSESWSFHNERVPYEQYMEQSCIGT